MNLLGQIICWLILLRHIKSIPYRLELPPPEELRGATVNRKIKKPSLRDVVFVNYYTSDRVCKDLFRPWWKYSLERRQSLYGQKILTQELRSVVELMKPAPDYILAPVQSVSAQMGCWKTVIRNKSESQKKRYLCTFTCEDVRSDLELYLSLIITNMVQTRSRGPVTMRCPDGTQAFIEKKADEREYPTDRDLMLEAMVREFRLTRYFQSYPAGPGRSPQGEDIDRCVCIPDDEWKRRMGAKERAERIDAERLERTRTKRPRQDQAGPSNTDETGDLAPQEMQAVQTMSQAERCEPISEERRQVSMFNSQPIASHPYAEPSQELEEAYQFWTDVYPDMTTAELRHYDLPAVSFLDEMVDIVQDPSTSEVMSDGLASEELMDTNMALTFFVTESSTDGSS